MIRGTTPTVVFHLNGVPLRQFNDVYVTFKQRNILIEKTSDDVVKDDEANTISVRLSQEETLAFDKGIIYVQIRIKTETGSAFASPILNTSIDTILKEGVI